jgi:hypothetical protein
MPLKCLHSCWATFVVPVKVRCFRHAEYVPIYVSIVGVISDAAQIRRGAAGYRSRSGRRFEWRHMGFPLSHRPTEVQFRIEMAWFVQSVVLVVVLFVPYFPSHPLLVLPHQRCP